MPTFFRTPTKYQINRVLKKDVTPFHFKTKFKDNHINQKYGSKGTESREKFEPFRIGVLIQEARKKQKLTQQQLADKVGTTKNYIFQIENNASDIRLSTLMRIIKKGLGGNLILSVDI